ncbi:RICIN domain-containing protein [Nonomuraea sp. NPDC049028]|uniref:RICIN domain-containing protein n=1 Tax=Nonomuraea sp. NPDC049028 TaxID=3364348 RepID=UPI00371EFBB3
MRRSLLAIPAALALTFGLATAAHADQYPSTYIRSNASSSAKCIGLANGGSVDNGTLLVLWDCHYHVDQYWHGNADASIRSRAGTNKCVGLANGGSVDNGTPLVLWDCHGHPDQQWKFANVSGNVYAIRSLAAPDKCVGLANRGSTTNGTWLVLWDCHGNPDQQWQLPNRPSTYGFTS